MVRVVEGDLLEQRADAIVNAWNRNLLPWWLLVPQGVSGAIKRHGGHAPFRELARVGPMPLGTAVVTSAGRLPYKGIIHVAGINLLWRASERSIRDSVANALARAREHRFASVAFPIIGAGSGGFDEARALAFMRSELEKPGASEGLDITVVRFRKR
jgi:O-acetyl-ADP-ribose deacetylase (regulator of RNase III)